MVLSFVGWLHAEIGLADAIVRPQGLIVAFEHDAAGLENVAVVGGFKRLCDALFDQQDRQVRLPADFDQPFEDEIRDRGRNTQLSFNQNQIFGGAREPAADRQHLLLSA